MKSIIIRSGIGLITGLLALSSVVSQSYAADTAIPTGTLSVDRTLVRVGDRPKLTWQVSNPGGVTDLVTVTPTGTIIPKGSLQMTVRTLGVGFQSGSTLLPIEGSWSLNKGSFTRFFYGTSASVLPTKALLQTTVKLNDQIDFGARGWSGSSWYPFHGTSTSDRYVTILKNGDRAPSYVPAYDQASVKSFLAAYIDGSGKIKIGSRDLIILWECSTAAPGSTYFDMQDLVVLVTFQ